MEKTFAGGYKIVKFVKIFSLESFLLYGIAQLPGIYGNVNRPRTWVSLLPYTVFARSDAAATIYFIA